MVRRHYDPVTYMGIKVRGGFSSYGREMTAGTLLKQVELCRHTAQVLLDSVLLRGIPSAIFGTLLYWLMGLRPSADAFITFLFVFCTYTALVSARVEPQQH